MTGPAAPLSDQEIQDLLDGPDRAGRAVADAERRLAAQPRARAALDDYRRVWAVLAAEPPPFRAGFSDRVVARVASGEAPSAPVAAARPWAEHALLAFVVGVGLLYAARHRIPLAETWLADAAPVLLAALAVAALAEVADRLLVRRRAAL